MDEQVILARVKEYIAAEENPVFRSEVETLIADGNKAELADRFYRTLEFGTGGMRGVIGGGFNRMNTFVVRKVTQGLANYLAAVFPEKARAGKLKAVIARDARRFSPEFADAAAGVLAAQGITVYIFDDCRPTPLLSFAIRELGCDTGIVITASHNAPEYNGYKAYWSNGGQFVAPHDALIIEEIDKVAETKVMPKDEALAKGLILTLDSGTDDKFCAMIRGELFRPDLLRSQGAKLKFAYTPLHGVGAAFVERIFEEAGLSLLTVKEQRAPDGDFPTTGRSNPEEDPAMEMVLALGEQEKAAAAMATDGDADRFRAAFPDETGKMRLLSGNQMGILFADYILLSRKETNTMPEKPAIIRSVVTSPLVDRIAAGYGVDIVECLTGHKWICAVMDEFFEVGTHGFLFGYEESCSYTVEGAIRDKDGISAAALCAEMVLYWNTQGKTVLRRLDELYAQYGFLDDRAVSKVFTGQEGAEKIRAIMAKLRKEPPQEIAGRRVIAVRDLEQENTGLPESNVLQFFLDGGSNFAGRPSGTEPKIKFYINSMVAVEKGKTPAMARAEATQIAEGIIETINTWLK
jgi:phosphoglucomutase